jgi:hypothetical protein
VPEKPKVLEKKDKIVIDQGIYEHDKHDSQSRFEYKVIFF